MRATALLLLVLATAICVVGCKAREGTVKGQVFIVTQSRENVKLGLVSVQVFSDSMILAHIASRRATADAQRRAIQPQLDAAQSSLANAKQRLEAAARRFLNANAKMEAARTRMLAAPGDEELKQSFFETLTDDDQDVRVRERECHARAAELAAVKARYNGLDDGAFYLEGLPRPLTAAKSDANGEFAIQVPSDQPIVLAAFAQRQVLDRTEKYCWLVRVPVGAARRDKLLLSNDNLTTANSPLSVIHTAK